MKTFLTMLIAMGCLIANSFAQHEATSAVATSAGSVQSVLPVKFAASRYDSAWDKNPFLRVTRCAPGPPWGRDWGLVGMVNNAGKISVKIVNKQTGELKQLGNQDKPGAEYRLIEAHFDRNRAYASVDIARGADVQTIKWITP